MPDPKLALLIVLALFSIGFIYRWAVSAALQRRLAAVGGGDPSKPPSLAQVAIGFGTNFLDTLGIGSFATTTALFKLTNMVADECIPGTLNVGHGLAVVAQAFIFITVIQVDAFTLVTSIAAAVVGSWFGAGVVANLPRRAVQLGMGIGLLAAAVFMLMTNLGLFPAAGAALAFSGLRLVAALAFNTLFGALQTLGIGNYAPCLIVFSLMGLDTHAAFPIMMGSGAFPAMAAGIKFIQTRRYDLRTSLGLTIGGIPAVLIAGLIVRSMSLTTVRWLVVCVVIYTGVTMLRSAWQNAPSGRQAIPL